MPRQIYGGRVSAKAEERIDRDDSVFLARRLIGEAGTSGRSSDAMCAAAVSGCEVPESRYPRDLSDLGRCCEAFAVAPYELRRRMLPILGMFIEHLSSAHTHSDAGQA